MTSKVVKLSVAFTSEHVAAMKDAVAAGAYASQSEVVRDAMRLWTAREARRRAREEVLGKLWDEGVASGSGVEMTPDQVLAHMQSNSNIPRRA